MNKISATALGLLIANAGVASAATKLPADLMYLGKPIDALCFSESADKTTIDLKDCGAAKLKYTVKGHNADLIKKGYTGFDWVDKKDPAYESQGYSYYKAFEADEKQYWVYSISNTGGSGDFSNVSLVKRTDPTTLTTKSITGGDRCNGGVQDVSGHNKQLTFSVNLTAYDLLPLANDNPNNLKAYDDLASCAVCCVAKVFYDTKSDGSLTYKYVELNKVANADELPDQGTRQACFNTLFASYTAKGKTKLDEAELKQFVREFNETCVK